MAAYAALVTLGRVTDLILPQDQDYVSLCSREQMESLHNDIFLLQKFLEDISGKSHSTLGVLESRIREVAYELEDFIESVISRLVGQRFGREDAQLPLQPTSNAFASCAGEVENLLKEAMEMKKELSDKKRVPRAILSHASPRLSVEAPATEDTTAGLGEDLGRIFQHITSRQRSGSARQIFAITGMGGIGKTTLARAVYEDKRTLSHFDIRSRVTVSQEYNPLEILQRILLAVDLIGKEVEKKKDKEGEDEDESRGDDLTTRIHKRLKGRRYLIILDDMWDQKAWDGVMNAFPDDNKGSFIIITTRNEGLAGCIDSSSHVYPMKTLNEGASWDLMRKEACCPAKFYEIGKEIARNCKGFPLVIVVIAGLLKINMSEDHWKGVAAGTKSGAAMNHNSVLKLLSLSYTNLPPHLKACFLYVGAFREDDEIQTKELVMLWTAEGFLKPNEAKRAEIVQECVEELVQRNLLLVTNRSRGKIRTVTVHDSIRELSITKAQEENFLHMEMSFASSKETKKGPRRVRLSTLAYLIRSGDNQSVRSLIYRGEHEHDLLPFIPSCASLLKVLNKVHIYENSTLGFLSRLTNLRYFHFVFEETYSPLIVPESISDLLTLETLIVSGSGHGFGEYDVVFPKQIWEMPRLLHLILMADSHLPDPVLSQGSAPVNCLHTLSRVLNFNFTESVIERIQNLKRLKVEYYYSGNETFTNDKQQIALDNLVRLHRLEELTLVCRFHLYESRRPTGHAFPKNLTKLTLEETKIPWEKMSLVRSLRKLEVLKLKWESFVGEVWEQCDDGDDDDDDDGDDDDDNDDEGVFPQLRYLKMEELGIKYWRCDESHFPSLEKVIIQSCWYLEEVPTNIEEICTLETLILEDCESAREAVKDLKAQVDRCGSSLDVIFR